MGEEGREIEADIVEVSLQDRNLATLEFLGSWCAIRRAQEK